MAFILVRHGETDGNAQRIVQVPSTPLNAHGVRQAEAVAARLASELAGCRPRLVSSDLTRAAMTAEAIGAALGVPVELEPLLQERSFGDHRGRRYAEIGFDIMAPDHVPPGGESWAAFHQRADRAWKVLRSLLEAEECLVAVSHGLVCWSLASRHLALEPEVEAPMRWGNTSVTVVESHPPYRVSTLNCTSHLDAETADLGELSGI